MKTFIKSWLVMGLFIGACTKEEAPPAEPETPEPAAEAAAEAKPEEPKSNVTADCVGEVSATGQEQSVKLGKNTWVQKGSTLKLKTKAAGSKFLIGAVTDIKEDTEENLNNLKSFTKWFQKKKVDAIVVAGDTGESQKQIEAGLDVLASAGIPVFTIIGNREGQKGYDAALQAVQSRHKHVFDLNKVRRVDTPHTDLVSLPGYFNSSFIHHENGCQYTEEHVKQLGDIAKQADSPVVLVSHGGPKQEGDEALDRIHEGDNVGDPLLTQVMQEAKIPFGIFGNIHEAGGRGTSLDGKLVKPKKMVDALYLNPGPADAVRWPMNDKSESVGMASLLTITKKGKASYEVFRVGTGKMGKKSGKKGKKGKQG